MLTRFETPISVPTVSKKSTKKKVNTTTQNSGLAISEKSILQNIGESDGGMETTPSGIFVIPRGIPTIVITIIPIRIPPVTLRASSTTMRMRPASESRAGRLARRGVRPRSTASLLTMIVALCRPIKVMKSPMPAEMPIFSDLGIELTTSSRTFVSVSTMNITPSMKTAASATCHGSFIPMTTAKAKKALSPMPGASANG